MRNHPITRLCNWLQEEYPDATLEFSRYVYKQYGRTESREVFRSAVRDVSSDWLKQETQCLADSQELAIHSRIWLANGQVRHIPMIDFANTQSPVQAANRTRYITNSFGKPIDLYLSGNSLHGYYYQLISTKAWYNFLGSLLLCNLPNKIDEDVIDARWIGHSLKHRFSALRWTRHSNTYKRIPTRVSLPSGHEIYS